MSYHKLKYSVSYQIIAGKDKNKQIYTVIIKTILIKYEIHPINSDIVKLYSL
jgi:hypothetical protein